MENNIKTVQNTDVKQAVEVNVEDFEIEELKSVPLALVQSEKEYCS